MPRMIFTPGEEALAADMQEVADATVAGFDSAAQRGAQWPVPFDGALSYTADDGYVAQYDATAVEWIKMFRIGQIGQMQVNALEVAYPTSTQYLTAPSTLGPPDRHAHSRTVGHNFSDPLQYGTASVNEAGLLVFTRITGYPDATTFTAIRSKFQVLCPNLNFTGQAGGLELIGSTGSFWGWLVYGSDRLQPEMYLTNDAQTPGKADLFVKGNVYADNVAALAARIDQLEATLAAMGAPLTAQTTPPPPTFTVPPDVEEPHQD